MNNLTRIMPIPFWAQGPLVTPFGISFGGGVGEFSLTQGRLDRLWVGRYVVGQGCWHHNFANKTKNNCLLRRQRVRPAKRNVGWEGLVLSWACWVVKLLTWKSGPSMACFVLFDLEMRFVPQRREFFDILIRGTRQFWAFWLGNALRATMASAHEVLCTFWLGNVLRATAIFQF